MTGTIQVVRPFSGHEIRVNALGVLSVFDVATQEWLSIGVVIKLAEEESESKWITHNIGAACARRFVSEWEAADE